jgi:GT2 family glycosyltransferase
MKYSPLSEGNLALRNKQFEKALHHYRKAEQTQPELARLIKANIKLVTRRLDGARAQQPEEQVIGIDIVVPVFNALADVKVCLASLQNHTDGFKVRVIVVNDGSDEATTQWLQEFCEGKQNFSLIERPTNTGYTRAVNCGLKASTAPYVITQNSDTIVSDGWLKGLIRCMRSAPNIGIVGPLSNAASWQNVPQIRDATGSFAINDLPAGMDVDAMARTVAQASIRAYPRLPFVNGFCFMISRAVIEAVGYMDELNFPVGFGEENDFCIRAQDAGFELAIADDVFVFHAKSKSFGHERRKALSEQGTRSLKNKHTVEKYQARVETVKKTEELDLVRVRIQRALDQGRSHEGVDLMKMRILFLLPVKGGGGGAHSAVQEVTEMRRMGIDARLAVKNEHVEGFLKIYSDIAGAVDTFVGFDDYSLIGLAEDYDVVVGTIFTSMKMVKRIVEIIPHIMPAYYVQDYEPMFFDEGIASWQEARESYTLVPNAFMFAKTQWIIDEVKRHHGVAVHKVKPSIDHDVYKPIKRHADGKLNVTAMIRPQTPRRGAERTMRLLAKLHQKQGHRICIHLFGCESEHADFQRLERDFPFQNHGPLLRPQVAHLLAQSDLFIDLSDYQAFGRTALEAMACGCAAVVPKAGGAHEYALHNENALILDTQNEPACIDEIANLLERPEALQRLRRNGLFTASCYSVHSAAISEVVSLEAALNAWRINHPHHNKPILHLLPSLR